MYLFLINPEAGNKRFPRVEKKMKKMLNRCKIKHRFVMVDDLANVPEIIQKNLRHSDKGIVVVGGNGTVNAVINATVTENLPLGIVPMSKTNYLAHSLGINNWEQAIKMLDKPEFKEERLGRIGKHFFVKQINVVSRQNLLTKYFNTSNPILKFLGVGKSHKIQDDKIATKIVMDDDLYAVSETQKIEVTLNSHKNDKKLQIRLFVPTEDGLDTSLLHSNSLAIDSDKKMPVTMGNETIAFTPVEIRGLTKHIQLIIPKGTEDKLTERVK